MKKEFMLFCPNCGWEGLEKDCHYSEWSYCNTHDIKLDARGIMDGKGIMQPYCSAGRHIPSKKEIKISKKRSMWCPKCGYCYGLMPCLVEKRQSYSCEGTLVDVGFGMITQRAVIRFDGKNMHWENKDGTPDDTMAAIIPISNPLLTLMRLKKGDKFKVTFERVKK